MCRSTFKSITLLAKHLNLYFSLFTMYLFHVLVLLFLIGQMLHIRSSAKSCEINETFNLNYKAGYHYVSVC